MKEKLKIMVPVDFSPVSYKAIEFLSFIMEKTPVEAHFVHVIQVNAADWAGSSEASETIDKAEIKAQEQKAEKLFQVLEQKLNFNYKTDILHGGLTTALSKYSAKQEIDLVIMGTKGYDGWFEKLAGSEAQHIVRYNEAPVITIHEHASITPIHNILCIADFEKHQYAAPGIQTIKVLQQLFNAQVHLIQIIEKEDAAQVAHIKQSMQAFADEHQLLNYELHLKSDHKIPDGVRNFNRETEMDLVCIGTHGRKGISHLFYGSIAETLVNQCIRPLLTYHYKD